MSIVHLVRCEQYEECKQDFSIDAQDRGMTTMPGHWFVLFKGSPNLHVGLHFCSKRCLCNWLETLRYQAPETDDA